MTKRNFCEPVTLICPLGSSVLVKRVLRRCFASGFLLDHRHLLWGSGTEAPLGLSSRPTMGSRMAPRACWKGSAEALACHLSIALYPAQAQAEKTHFHQINTKDRPPSEATRWSTRAPATLLTTTIRERATSLSKGRYVEIDEHELEAVKLESTTPSRLMISFPPRISMNGTSTNHITSYQTARQARTRSLSSVMR